MPEPLELKKTLNLPKTDFPMKASLPQNEPKQLASWQEERLYERILEVRKGKVPPADFRKLCREFATRYVEQHKRDFKRLGIFGQWNDPYLTMSFDYEATIAGAFLDFMESGYVYRGRKPVYWCIYDSTALAEAEVEYEDHSSPSIFVRYKLA